MTRDELFILHEQMCDEALSLMRKKNSDYSSTGPFDNFFLCEHLGAASAELGIAIRMSDKLSRLVNILQRDAKITSESKKDTLLDLINYAILLAGLIKHKTETERGSSRDAMKGQ